MLHSMTNPNASAVASLLAAWGGKPVADRLLGTLHVNETLLRSDPKVVTRAQLAQAMNMALFAQLIDRVPEGAAYVEDVRDLGRRVVFDHGAVRTVLFPQASSCAIGHKLFARILEPLGFVEAEHYPLDRLGMLGRAYTHLDFPEDIAQFFVSELIPERFSPAFQQTVTRVLSTTKDPLTSTAAESLARLAHNRVIPTHEAAELLPVLVACFGRHHEVPTLRDYEALRQESEEMAWIATEGNVFNHATDRVDDVFMLAEGQRKRGRPMKDKVEVSRSGRVRQTAFRATKVAREFRQDDGTRVTRQVPGSFYEFISRSRFLDATRGQHRLDLSFDTGNAQGIFAMTSAA